MIGNPSTVAAAAKAATEVGHISPFGPLNTGLISIMITLLVIAMKNQIANRKMTIQVNGEVRQEFIAEMHALRDSVGGLREDNDKLRGEVRTLRRENDQLRDEVRSLHGVIDGMRRDNLQSGLSTQRAVVDSLPRDMVPPSTLAALDRLKGQGE